MKLTRRSRPYLRPAGPGTLVLVATRSKDQEPQFPPVDFVHGEQKIEEVELGPTGTLYSFTVVHTSEDGVPYGLAMVDFPQGVRAFGRFVFGSSRDVSLGAPVRVVPHTLEDGTPDYAFEPI